MSKKYILAGLLLLIVIISALAAYMSQGLKREYRKLVNQAIVLNSAPKQGILTSEDIGRLPVPVQKYLIYTGAVGREKVQNIKLTAVGEMKLNEKAGWLKASFEQYNFFGSHPERLFYLKVKMFGIPILGLHSYTDEQARMHIKLLGLIPVADVNNRESRISDTVTLLNDICFFAPAALIDDRISWETIDSRTAKATFKTDYCTVSAMLYFNDKGELINFISDDRYMIENDGTSRQVRWSTPISAYKELDGIKIVSQGEAVWNFPDHDYSYFKITDVKEIRYNRDHFE